MRSFVRAFFIVSLLLISLASFVWLGYRLGELHGNPSQGAQFANSAAKQLGPPPIPSKSEIVRLFSAVWYFDAATTWESTRWLGIVTEQNPMDVWVTQEIMYDTKPDFVVECGSGFGGSAALWATMLAQINPAGRVISIDTVDRMDEARKLPIVKQRVRFLIGSSTDPAIVADVARRIKGRRILVILDSLHTKEHVLNELKAYSPLLSVGDYIIVQDTNLNGHPVVLTHNTGPGGYEATQEFLASNSSFAVDESRERLLFTLNPKGFLRRIK